MTKRVTVFTLVAGLTIVLLLSGFGNDNLPPRPTPIPTPMPTAVPLAKGSQIQLHLENELDEIPPQLWTVIEWQDTTTGDWHVVEGWRGTLDAPTTQTWWVGAEQLGTGPFRWQLYASENGALLATSTSFDLPTQARMTVVVTMALE